MCGEKDVFEERLHLDVVAENHAQWFPGDTSAVPPVTPPSAIIPPDDIEFTQAWPAPSDRNVILNTKLFSDKLWNKTEMVIHRP